MAKTIETGVDRLMELVSEKEKISIDAAAKQLGVSKLVVTEWAEFLADEKLISMEYSLSKTYLKERELSKSDVEKKAKQYSNKKEAFVRKVDTSMNQLERASENFAAIRREFDDLKDELGGQIDDVKHEIDQLQQYEKMKSKVEKDVEQEVDKYKKQIADASGAIEREEKKFKSLMGDIEKEEDRLSKEQKRLHDLEALEEKFKEKADKLDEFLQDARKQIKSGISDVKLTEKHIDDLKDQADKLKGNVESVKKKSIDPLESAREEHEEQIDSLRKAIMEKAKKTREAVEKDVEAGKVAADQFEKFFKKRLKVEKDIKALDKEQKELHDELEQLKKAALGFSIAGKKDVKSHIKELESKYDKLEKRRAKYKSKLGKLVKGLFS